VSDSFQPPLGSREERIAHNEAWSRSLNERKAEWMSGRDPMAGFRCECWQADCSERILLSGSEWEMVRSRPNRFAVAPDHVADNIEAVIDEHSRFWLVEKYGKAGQIAEELASSD
jgi:hypothetical protein